MSIEKLLTGLPTRTAAERKVMQANAQGLLATGSPAQQAAAQALLDALDALGPAESAARAKRLNGMGLAGRVFEAFSASPMTATDEKVIRVLLNNPGRTSADLSALMGWKGQTWHLHFGTMCGNRSDYLWEAPIPAKRSATFLSGVLVAYDQETSAFTMRPEAVAGFATLGILAKTRAAA